jgi:hypothetical protein
MGLRTVILATGLSVGCNRYDCEEPAHPFEVEGVLTGAEIDRARRMDVGGLGPCTGACFAAARLEREGRPVEIDDCTLELDPEYVPSDDPYYGYYGHGYYGYGYYGYYGYEHTWTSDSGAIDTAAPDDRPGGTVACSGRAVRQTCYGW